MKKIKLDYRQIYEHRLKQRSQLFSMHLNKMFKIENWIILLIAVLAMEIQGIYSQGKNFIYF